MILTENFDYAVKDYLYLSEKGYSQKVILKLVGDRYGLSGEQRSILYRGITTSANVKSRQKKLVTKIDSGVRFTIDTLNVLVTVGSYLQGKTVFVSNDQWLRDASWLRTKSSVKLPWEKAVYLTLSYLEDTQAGDLVFFIDLKDNFSAKIAELIYEGGVSRNLKLRIVESGSTDQALSEIAEGLIATSDSWIIDQSQVKVYDLAKMVLEYHYDPKFPNLFYRYTGIL